MVDSAWLQAQGISRSSIHDYVQRGWLERVVPRVYRRATPSGAPATVRWDMAVMSVQATGAASLHVGGTTALELLGFGHFARLGGKRSVHLYDQEQTAPSWLAKLPSDASLVLHVRPIFSEASLGVVWHRLDLGTTRLGAAIPSPTAGEPWDHFLRVAGAERATIEMMDDVPRGQTFEHADTIFEGLTNLRPRLVTDLLESCRSIRAKRLFLFYADRHDHGWSKHIDRARIDLGTGKRQLAQGGRLVPAYQITVPAALAVKAGGDTP